ncbi:MAG: site-2 protease family protein, partial [Planctomycetes bacterium]|nr:site-2 protease family protein [Planctomycetota bacterium]
MTFAFLESLLYIFEIIIGISFIIFIHELGHFSIAKWRGVRCETFSFGFGPKIIRWIPKYPWKPNDPNFKYKDVITEDMLESPEDLEWLVRTKRLRMRKYPISKVTEGMVAVKSDKKNEKFGAELLTTEKIAELKEKGENKILIYDASETEYTASLFWLGGYVKMAGDFEGDKKKRGL